MKTLKIPEITEVNEDEEDDTRSVFSVQVKDEISHYKDKMQEYMDLIQEMTDEVERVEQENEGLYDDIDMLTRQLEEGEMHMAKLKGESNGWTKKFLTVLQELEDNKRGYEELEEKFKDSQKELEILRRQNKGKVGGEEVLEDMQVLFRENENLKNELSKVKVQKEEISKQNMALEENVNNVQSSYKLLSSQLMEAIEKKDFLQSKIHVMQQDQETTEKLMEINQEEEVMNLREKVELFKNENRQLTTEVKTLRTKNLELESELNFLNQKDNHLGLTSQLETSRMLLDMTQDIGNTSIYGGFNKTMNMTNFNINESDQMSMLSKHQGNTNNPDEPFDKILGESLNQEVFEELEQKKREIEELKVEKERILANKKEEISELQEKLIQCQKDFDFKIEAMEKRFKHDSKMMKKQNKRKTKELKQMERKMVQLKIQACDMIVQKDELEIGLTKQIKILRARVNEYEQDIREYNLMNKTRDNRTLWDKLFS
jgi:DNA repair exonuclease SbcCD ATPase subunit